MTPQYLNVKVRRSPDPIQDSEREEFARRIAEYKRREERIRRFLQHLKIEKVRPLLPFHLRELFDELSRLLGA